MIITEARARLRPRLAHTTQQQSRWTARTGPAAAMPGDIAAAGPRARHSSCRSSADVRQRLGAGGAMVPAVPCSVGNLCRGCNRVTSAPCSVSPLPDSATGNSSGNALGASCASCTACVVDESLQMREKPPDQPVNIPGVDGVATLKLRSLDRLRNT